MIISFVVARRVFDCDAFWILATITFGFWKGFEWLQDWRWIAMFIFLKIELIACSYLNEIELKAIIVAKIT